MASNSLNNGWRQARNAYNRALDTGDTDAMVAALVKLNSLRATAAYRAHVAWSTGVMRTNQPTITAEAIQPTRIIPVL